MSVGPDPRFWRGKRVLLTGHTGFKGAWLRHWLCSMGALVYGYSLAPATSPSLHTLLGGHANLIETLADIRDLVCMKDAVLEFQPEVVLHLAAQALVRQSYLEPADTFRTNVMGTVNLLEAVRTVGSVRVVVVVTTDKVYRNREWVWPYREDDTLGGHDPYSASKAAAELVAESYRLSFLAAGGTALVTARAGNVVGGGDWSSDRLIPDAVRAWSLGNPLVLRRPDAVRPWQHVLDPLAGYLILAEQLWQGLPTSIHAFNFGPAPSAAATVRKVVDVARASWPDAQVSYKADIGGPHEAHWLSLDTTRAQQVLGVQSRLDLVATLTRTVHWYRQHLSGDSATSLCDADIALWSNQ